MYSFLIFACSRCGGLVAAKTEQKTKICPYCGFRIILSKCRPIASANGTQEASKILRKLKKAAKMGES